MKPLSAKTQCELVEALRPFAEAFEKRGEIGAPIRQNWFSRMPAHWPIDLTVKMDHGRNACATLAKARAEMEIGDD